MSHTRLAALAPLAAGHPPAELARAVDTFVGAPHRLLAPVAGPWLAPALTGRLPAPAALLSLVRALSGRLVVTNPCATVRLPWAAGALVRMALRRALGSAESAPVGPSRHAHADARAGADRRRWDALASRLAEAATVLAPGATWGTAALYEPTALTVTLDRELQAPPEPEPVGAVAILCYRLAVGVRRGTGTGTDGRALLDALDAQVAAAAATPWPPGPQAQSPWFTRRVLLPDALAAAQMDPGMLARWAALTGRGGPTPRDRYWFGDSWARFREPGRQVGHVTPDDVARSRRTRMPPPPSTGWSAAPASTLDSAAERGVCVPPGYCLVECRGTLEVSVVAL